MVVMPSWSVREVSFSHPSKAPDPILVTEVGISNVSRLVQPLKAENPSNFDPSSNVIFFKFVQPWKGTSKSVIVLGITISVNDVQLLNMRRNNMVVPCGIVIFLSLVQPLKKPAAPKLQESSHIYVSKLVIPP